MREKADEYFPNHLSDPSEASEHFKYWHSFAENYLFWIEINESIARVAKMNMILHDVNLAAFYCDRLLLLADQKILCCAEPKDALTEDNLQQLYGVKGRAIEHPFYPEKCLVVWC